MTGKIGLLCILLHVCLVQGYISNSLDQEIQEVKLSAKKVVEVSKTLRTHVQHYEEKILGNGNYEIIQKTNSSFDYSHTEIVKAVNAAKALGKDADICLTNAENSFEDITLDGNNKLSSYKENATSDLKPIMDSVESEIKQGENIAYELDMTNLLCFSLNSTEHTACVNMKLEAYRTIIDHMKGRLEKITFPDEKLVLDARSRYQSFCKEYEKNIESMIGNVMLSASKCLKNAEYFSKTDSTTIKPIAKKEVVRIEEFEWMDLLGF